MTLISKFPQTKCLQDIKSIYNVCEDQNGCVGILLVLQTNSTKHPHINFTALTPTQVAAHSIVCAYIYMLPREDESSMYIIMCIRMMPYMPWDAYTKCFRNWCSCIMNSVIIMQSIDIKYIFYYKMLHSQLYITTTTFTKGPLLWNVKIMSSSSNPQVKKWATRQRCGSSAMPLD